MNLRRVSKISCPIPGIREPGGRKDLSLREAIMVALLYKRQNIVRRSYCRSFLVFPGHRLGDHHRIHPADRAGYRGVPTGRGGSEADDPGLAQRLVDGTLWPSWSWKRAPEMWAGKYKTTGHGSLIISDEFGNIIFVSDPVPGCDHDMKKREGEVKEILDLAGSVIADKRISRVRLRHAG